MPSRPSATRRRASSAKAQLCAGDGRLLAAGVTGADGQDRDGGTALVRRLVRLCPWIKTVVVDGGDKKRVADAAQALSGRGVEVVKRPESAKGFVLPRAKMRR